MCGCVFVFTFSCNVGKCTILICYLQRRPFEEYGNDDEEEEEEYHWKGKLNELREFQNFVDQMTSPQALDKTREVSSGNVQTNQTRAYSSGSLHLTKNPEFLRESPSDVSVYLRFLQFHICMHKLIVCVCVIDVWQKFSYR